ncbi:cytochrome P450 [Nocardia sp. NPDC050175]|uniref:cytochrome P450 n=1 Tax=Nocardia sp. NPDC050175 TaxID=3364317 RepID=UPI0037892EA5
MVTKVDVNLFDPALDADPHELYRRLRAESPVCKIALPDRREVWLVTPYQEVLVILKDQARFSSRAMLSQSGDIPGVSPAARDVMSLFDQFMSSNDPPEHERLRGLVSRVFTPQMVGGLREFITEVTDQLIDDIVRRPGDPTFDLISDFAFPLPIAVIMRLLGIPPEDRDRLRHWSDVLVRFDRSARSAEELAPDVAEFITYVRALLDRKRRTETDDLLGKVVRQSDVGRLSEIELVSMTFGLIFAGHETTTHLLGNGMLSLLEHPDELERLRAKPSLIDWAVEELLRYEGPVVLRRRLVTEDVTVRGEQLARGDLVLVSLAAANRDPEVFADPERLDIGRRDNPHLAFARGIHTCLGAALARLEARIAVPALVRRLPELRVAVPRAELRWRPSGLHLRGLRELPLRY